MLCYRIATVYRTMPNDPVFRQRAITACSHLIHSTAHSTPIAQNVTCKKCKNSRDFQHVEVGNPWNSAYIHNKRRAK